MSCSLSGLYAPPNCPGGQGSIVGLASLFSIRLLRPPLATDFLTILRALHFGNSLISISHLTNHLIIY